ncbi:MAG: hypothetical protein ACREYB_11170 [Casimicrobiaceae bacterium]
MNQIAKIRLCQELHRGPRILVPGNVCYEASAHLFEDAGMQAVGTTRAGIATCHGHRDAGFLQPTV